MKMNVATGLPSREKGRQGATIEQEAAKNEIEDLLCVVIQSHSAALCARPFLTRESMKFSPLCVMQFVFERMAQQSIARELN